MGLQPQRPITWSPTRAETLRRCPRRYYYAFIAASRGRDPRACDLDRTAFILSRLTSLELAIGTAVHARAREVARLAVRGAPAPAASDLLEQCRGELNHLWQAGRDIPAFLAAPERRVAFAEILYERPPGEGRLDRLRERLRNCIISLVEHSVWEEVRTLPRAATRIVDRPIRVDAPGTTYWGAPDLVLTVRGERTVVLDWKTGREDAEAVARQLGSYAWIVRDGLRLPMLNQPCETRAVFLASGTETVQTLGLVEIDDAREHAQSQVQEMSTLPQEERTAFPLTQSRRQCPFCPFWDLCEREISDSTCKSAAPPSTDGISPGAAHPGGSQRWQDISPADGEPSAEGGIDRRR